MSRNSDASDFFWLPAKFIVKCVLGPSRPSFSTTFFEMKLVFQPLSSIARASVKFPFWPLISTFWTGQIAGTLVLPWTLWLLASWLSFADESVSVPWYEFARGTSSLCKERWWRRVHLSQVVPSGFLQEFVWLDVLQFPTFHQLLTFGT